MFKNSVDCIINDRYLCFVDGKIFDKEKERFIKKSIKNDDNYESVWLRDKNNVGKRYYCHRIIYQSFHNLITLDEHLEIDHINNIRNDNNINNLQCLSHRENIIKAHKDKNNKPYHELDKILYQQRKERREKKNKIINENLED